MLVLKRKLGEAIIITTQSDETVEIKVSEISEGRVKLGIDAEKSIAVLRKEVDFAHIDDWCLCFHRSTKISRSRL